VIATATTTVIDLSGLPFLKRYLEMRRILKSGGMALLAYGDITFKVRE